MKTAVRWAFAAFLVFAGVMHFRRLDAFLSIVPTWLPARDWFVWVSGVAEIAFGIALVLPLKRRAPVGYALAIFLVVIFPGNINQAILGIDTFGLSSDAARLIRLPFQPLLILVALWMTDAWPSNPALRLRQKEMSAPPSRLAP